MTKCVRMRLQAFYSIEEVTIDFEDGTCTVPCKASWYKGGHKGASDGGAGAQLYQGIA